MDNGKAARICGQISSSQLSDLRKSLVSQAVRYSRPRGDWELAVMAERRAMDAARTKAHDSFIDSCNILSRNMDKNGEEIDWRYELGDDRKEIGERTCYISLFLGLRAREDNFKPHQSLR